MPKLDDKDINGFRVLFETALIRKLQQLAKVNILRISDLKVILFKHYKLINFLI